MANWRHDRAQMRFATPALVMLLTACSSENSAESVATCAETAGNLLPNGSFEQSERITSQADGGDCGRYIRVNTIKPYEQIEQTITLPEEVPAGTRFEFGASLRASNNIDVMLGFERTRWQPLTRDTWTRVEGVYVTTYPTKTIPFVVASTIKTPCEFDVDRLWIVRK